MGKSDAFGWLPEHLSKSDPQCCWLCLLIIDRGTQTHTHARLYMLSWTIRTNEALSLWKWPHSILLLDRGHQDQTIPFRQPLNHLLLQNARGSYNLGYFTHREK